MGSRDLEARSGRSVFAGVNSEGFAITNSLAYNLPKTAGDAEDRERTAKFLASPRTPQGLASFQDEMVANALEALRSIQP